MAATQKMDLARTTVRGTFWTYAAHYSGKFMVFLSTIILARLLIQEDFGVAGYALVVIGFLDVISDLGVGAALIFYPDKPETRDTAFWLGLLVGGVLFALSWWGAPWVGVFFNDPRAVSVTRALALTFPVSALGNVHKMLLLKGLAFDRKFVPDLTRAMGKGGLSIMLAALGFGEWSLIWGQVGGTALAVIALWWVLPWRPSFRFRLEPARLLLSYGLNIVAVNTVAVIIVNGDYLMIGRFLGATALGIYSVAFRIPELVILQFCNVVTKVIFPVYARMREEDPTALQQGFLVATRYISMITVPLGLGIALVAEPFVLTIFTEKWVDAIPVLQAIAIYALFASLEYSAGDVYKAQGRPSVLTKLGLVRVVILLPALWWTLQEVGTIEAVAWMQTAITALASALNLWVASRLLNAPLGQLLQVFQPAVMGGVVMSLVVINLLWLVPTWPPVAQLALCVVGGAVAYVATLWWVHREVVLMASKTLQTAFGRG